MAEYQSQATTGAGEVVYSPPEMSVRGMPVGPRGGQGAMALHAILDLGAHASATGMTRSKISGFVDKAQEAALRSIIDALPALLQHSREIAQAKLNEVAGRIDRLPRKALIRPLPPQSGWRGLLGREPSQPYWGEAFEDAPAYVSLADVKTVLAETIAALTVQD